MSILIVDDEELVRTVAREILSRAGYVVNVAASGADALTSLAEHRSELILLDWSMPGQSGRELCALLRSNSPKVPIIITSGYDAVEVADLLNSTDKVTFLKKPFRAPQLLSAVAASLTEANQETL